MGGIQHLCVLWMVVISRHVHGEVVLIERQAGESVVIPCSVLPDGKAPYAFSLKRCWLRRDEALFMHTKADASVTDRALTARVRVSGDPVDRQVNVTISELSPADTDRYCCEFIVDDLRDDRTVPGDVQFFVYVADDAPSSAEVVHVEACTGGSAVLPCTRPPGEGQQGAVEGYSLKRRKGSSPVEVLYHSLYHHHQQHQQQHNPASPAARLPSSSSYSSSSSPFPAERLRFMPTATAGGMSFNLTLWHLQPQDSGFYSCTLLLAGRLQASSSLGPRVFYVSVQGGQCDCSSYTTLLYALFAAVATTLLMLLALVVYQVKASSRVKPQAPVPIYEEMIGVRSPKPKLGPCGLGTFHLEEVEVSDYSNSHVAKVPRAENHYESPRLARISQS